MLLIFDARSRAAEIGNRLIKGKGSELPKNYPNTRVLFMEIDNIHAVRKSHDALRELCEQCATAEDDPNGPQSGGGMIGAGQGSEGDGGTGGVKVEEGTAEA